MRFMTYAKPSPRSGSAKPKDPPAPGVPKALSELPNLHIADGFKNPSEKRLSIRRISSNVPRAGGRQIPTLRVSGVVELRERSSNRVVWTAVLSCERRGTDDVALFAHLANAVAPWIGQPLAGRPF